MSSQGCTLFRDSSGCVNAELFIIRPRCVYPCRENKKEERDGEQLAETILPSKTFTLSEVRRKMLRSKSFLADLCSNMCEIFSVVKVQKGILFLNISVKPEKEQSHESILNITTVYSALRTVFSINLDNATLVLSWETS